ncbi:MAG: galactokinase [Longimicrobiales bacterium]
MDERPIIPAAERAASALREALGRDGMLLARAPGRVNLIGEHVDYNGGYVLPVAIDRDVAVAASQRDDGVLRVLATDLGEITTIQLADLLVDRRDRATLVPQGWSDYVRGVAAVLIEEGIELRGADLSIAGDVPPGVGLSSSAALEVACAHSFLELAGATLPPERIATLCRRAEVEWAGVSCGIMDQFIAVLGRAEHALFLDCRSLAYEHVRIPAGVRLVATYSGIRRGLQDSAFNQRVRECREAAQLLGVGELRDVSPDYFATKEAELPEPMRRRARHVVLEIERTCQAAQALREGDAARVGELMIASHAGLRDDYQVSTTDLEALVESALRLDGVLGSRISGAGFGGCTITLVEESAVDVFAREVPIAYRRATGREAAVYVCRAGSGATATTVES